MTCAQMEPVVSTHDQTYIGPCSHGLGSCRDA